MIAEYFRYAELEVRAHRFAASLPGPELIVLGAVHGNEICGSLAIRQILSAFEEGELSIQRGGVTFVPVTNPLAWKKRQREGERNLNRRLLPTAKPADFEDHLANWLCPLLARHEVLLDLHSFHTPGEPFVMLGPDNNSGPVEAFAHAEEERALARHLGIPLFVDGWLDTYARGVKRRRSLLADSGHADTLVADPSYGIGTTEYMRTQSGYGLTVECGQHDDPQAVGVARQCILNTLAFLGLIEEAPPAPLQRVRHMRIVDVVDKTHDHDAFEREWNSFDRIAAGELIGTRAEGTAVRAWEDGYLLFPNPAAGALQEWFYLAREITPAGR